MEKDRGTKILAVLAICFAVIGMTVGFAAFSTELRIQGTGTIKSASFDVVFNNLLPVTKTGTAVETSTPAIQEGSTTISNYAVELMTPGDSISYTFDIENRGTFDAEITSIVIAGTAAEPFVVTGSGDSKTTDETNVKENLTYTLQYADTHADLAVGDELAKQTGANPTSRTVILTLTYNEFNDATKLPKAPVTIDNLGVTITYTQA